MMTDYAVMTRPASAKMEVAEYELGNWYLFSFGDDFYLDVRTGIHGYGFWLLLKFNGLEAASYREGKKIYVRNLVGRILRSPSVYFMRNESIEMQKIAFDALTAWRNSPRRPRV